MLRYMPPSDAHRLGPSAIPIATTNALDALLRVGCVVAVGVSGGKDSHAAAVAVARHLDAIEHAGPRVLVHSDLGRVEWRDSLPACERLASALGWELLIVRRQAGDMRGICLRLWVSASARRLASRCTTREDATSAIGTAS
jgi:hypothetical protein